MKTCVIYHSVDLDGFMSAAIVKLWHKKQQQHYLDSKVFKEVDVKLTIDFIGYNYRQSIPDLSGYDKVIMCDISFPYDEMCNLFDKLESKFIWIDHHKSALQMMFIDNERSIHPIGRQNVSYAACELTWQYFFPNDTIPEIVRLLGLYDSFRHKGTDEEQKVLEFQYGARSYISNYDEAYKWLLHDINDDKNHVDRYRKSINSISDSGYAIYNYLCIDAKQSYKNGFKLIFDIEDPTQQVFGDDRLGYKFICINKERFNPINFGIDYHTDGYDGAACFHYANGKYNFSLYNDNEKVDCSIIAKQFGGGGHKGAAGFALTKEQFINLIK